MSESASKENRQVEREQQIMQRIPQLKGSLHRFVAGEPLIAAVYALVECASEIVPAGEMQEVMLRDIVDEVLAGRTAQRTNN